MTGGQRLSPKRPMSTRKAERIPSRRPLKVRPNGRIVSVAVIVATGVSRRRLTRRIVRSRWPTAALPPDWPRRFGFASRRASARHQWRRRYVACSSAELLRAGLTGRIHLLRGLSRRLWWTGGVHAVVPSEIRRSAQVVTPHSRMNHVAGFRIGRPPDISDQQDQREAQDGDQHSKIKYLSVFSQNSLLQSSNFETFSQKQVASDSWKINSMTYHGPIAPPEWPR